MTLVRLSELASKYLPVPSTHDSKYTRGVVGFVTGGADYPGAALLGIAAALACPIGMVRYVGPVRVADLVLVEHPEVVVTQNASDAGRCQVWVLGSGVSPTDIDQSTNIRSVLKAPVTAVIDAGALDVLDFAEVASSNLILTPHVGEAVRLLERLTGSRVQLPQTVQQSVVLANQLQVAVGQTVLLKGSNTVIANGKQEALFIGPNSPHLATAGSGDVLAGLLGAIAAGITQASTVNWLEVAEFAVLLHSHAADAVAERQTVTASTLTHQLPVLIRRLQENA